MVSKLERPHFKEYVMARLVTIAVFIFLLFSFFSSLVLSNEEAFHVIAFLALGFWIFIYAIYRGAKHMQQELRIINNYLSNLEKVDKIEYEAQFFSQEFEDIHQNLIKVLESAKKREVIKQRYTAKLKLKNRQRGDMISAIAHEFRNPIASIMGYAQTLEEDKEIPSAIRERFLHKIYNNGMKIETLLSRLVLWNKFESKEATLEPSVFDILLLLEEIQSSLKEKFPQREIDIKAQSLEVKADRTLMEIVIKNLIENALKYSEEEVSVYLKGRRIEVVDKGIGIASEDMNKITKKFYRSGTHNWDNSMGLGLAIVKNILNLHQSELEISSEEGKGSVFAFSLNI